MAPFGVGVELVGSEGDVARPDAACTDGDEAEAGVEEGELPFEGLNTG